MSGTYGFRDRELGALAMGWLAAGGAAGAGVISLSLVDQVVLAAVAVVLPLAIGGRAWWWAAAAGAALVGFLVPIGAAAGMLACPFLAVALARLYVRMWPAARGFGTPPTVGQRTASHHQGSPPTDRLGVGAEVVATAYAVVAAAFLVLSRSGIEPLDLHEPIIELTAVHYSFAGAAALVLATDALRHADEGWRSVAVGAVVLTAAAPPVVAAGFVTRSAVLQVGGAVLMTLGVWLTATLQLRHAVKMRHMPLRAGLLAVSGLAVWAPMVLAVAWAAGQHWDIPILSIPDMARTHGLANAFAFSLCGLLARRIDQSTPSRLTDSVTV